MERAEQSDMVMFLMNLAYVPDKVVVALAESHGFKHGWQKEFLRLMEQNQKEFSSKYYPWRPQDGKMEDEYKKWYKAKREDKSSQLYTDREAD